MGTGPLSPLVNSFLPWAIAIIAFYAIVMMVGAGYNSNSDAKKMLNGVLCTAIFVSAIPLIRFIIETAL